jgi:hypothetical protein
MCLTNVKTKISQKATEDIIVFKALKVSLRFCDDDKSKELIDGITLQHKKNLYILSNNATFGEILGYHSIKTLGYDYGLELDNNVSESFIASLSVEKAYYTAFLNIPVTIGKLVSTNLSVPNRYSNIYLGIHSFKNLETCYKLELPYDIVAAKCTIPKGSQYYIGEFHEDVSYASDTLIYNEIINK